MNPRLEHQRRRVQAPFARVRAWDAQSDHRFADSPNRDDSRRTALPDVRRPSAAPQSKLSSGSLIYMKIFTVFTAALFLMFGAAVSNGAVVTRISDETGIPVDTLQAERASTGLGWGELEKAHLLANATGQSFDNIVALHQSGQGWGKIAHDNGQNLGRLVSNANRSSKATAHAQNTQTVHGKSSSVHGQSATNVLRGHSTRMTPTRGIN